MNVDHGPWDPLPLAEAVDLFRKAPFRWWVSGGHALELHVGRSWRSHDDTDISFCRDDARHLPEILAGAVLTLVKKQPSPAMANGAGIAGAAMILLGFAVVPQEGFPGAWTLLPLSAPV